MNDVVAVGLTTGAVGLVGSVLSYTSARSQSRTTFAVGIQSAQIELAKVQSENNRLRAQHREDERRERRSAYVAYLSTFRQYEVFGFLESATDEEFIATQTKFRLVHSTLAMVAPVEVRAKAEALDDLLKQVAQAAYQDANGYGLEVWRSAYRKKAKDLDRAIKAVTDAMHHDVIAQMLQPEA